MCGVQGISCTRRRFGAVLHFNCAVRSLLLWRMGKMDTTSMTQTTQSSTNVSTTRTQCECPTPAELLPKSQNRQYVHLSGSCKAAIVITLSLPCKSYWLTNLYSKVEISILADFACIQQLNISRIWRDFRVDLDAPSRHEETRTATRTTCRGLSGGSFNTAKRSLDIWSK
jgi:hypothetical protein